jgi:SAM-dependent methyltransferase
MERLATTVVEQLEPNATVMDVGCGGGEFLDALLRLQPTLNCVGIDPAAPNDASRWRSVQRIFRAGDIDTFQPDLILLRHVVEHLDKPRFLLESIAAHCRRPTLVLVEVPNATPAIEAVRFADWLYEHCSHFQPASLDALFECTQASNVVTEQAVDGQVLWSLREIPAAPAIPTELAHFREVAKHHPLSMNRVLSQLLADEECEVVFWGGTGKAAALMNRLAPAHAVMVVDGDARKVGEWVPGLGLPISHPKEVGPHPDVVVASMWRLPDILEEIEQMSIQPRAIWVEDGGELKRVDTQTS